MPISDCPGWRLRVVHFTFIPESSHAQTHGRADVLEASTAAPGRAALDAGAVTLVAVLVFVPEFSTRPCTESME